MLICSSAWAAAAADTNTLNLAPAVVPGLREWVGGEGMLSLATNAAIVVDRRSGSQLTGTASVLAEDLKQITGRDFPVVTADEPQPGGFYLTLSHPHSGLDPGLDSSLGMEGYRLQMDEAVVIQANTDTGVFYGTQTVLQILKLAGAQVMVPKGTARDYPLCGYRSQMIDVGRRYYQVNYLEEQIREMAWYKLNMLHLHFTDWDGFRLVSQTFPGLATAPAYTKADIRRLEAVAKRYHVIIVPEIDLPAHAKAITDFDPSLRFACSSMDTGHWEGSREGGWMLDVTRPEVRAWIKRLLDEFIPEFDGPYFHIGCDEWEFEAKQWACPELVAYMKKKGYASPTDVLVEWINEVNAQVKSYGKTTQIWNWWDYKQSSTLQPDKDIVINVWTASPDKFLAQGWKVIYSPEDGPEALYVSPGDGGTRLGQYGFLDSQRIYERWRMPANPNLLGFQLCRWSDKVEDRSDVWLDGWAQRPLQVLAERTWGSPRAATVQEFYNRVDAIGLPPAPALNFP
jgi:hexosaminidase